MVSRYWVSYKPARLHFMLREQDTRYEENKRTREHKNDVQDGHI